MNNKKLAVVYNKWLKTAGGGERSTVEYAMVLAKNGYRVEIVSDFGEKISLHSLYSQFGIEPNDNITLKEFADRASLVEYLKDIDIDVFCNHCAGDSIVNYGRIGLYVVMFPMLSVLKEKDNLKTYTHFICISEYTELYVKQFWFEDLNTVIIPTPILDSHFETKKSFNRKEKLIINIGRFNVDGHNKGQLQAVRAFRRLVKNGTLSSAWKLIVAGHFNNVLNTQRYVDACKRTAQGFNIDIQLNIPFEKLRRLYEDSSVLWQFTGYPLKYGIQPQKCEHLGLVAMDALAYGSIPVLYSRSGAGYLLDIGHDGFVFSSFDELANCMKLIDAVHGRRAHKKVFNNCIEKSQSFSFDSFSQQVIQTIT